MTRSLREKIWDVGAMEIGEEVSMVRAFRVVVAGGGRGGGGADVEEGMDVSSSLILSSLSLIARLGF